MTNYINLEASKHQMKLVMMGADVKQIYSKLCYVRFDLDRCRVSYVYNINKSNRYFLERIKPYPLPYRDFNNEEDIINEINFDIKQFQNAELSQNIYKFIQINKNIHNLMKEFEDLFLYYNVPKEKFAYLLDELSQISDMIKKVQNNSDKIFFESEP
ncbi:hypothetical protein KHQ81_03300 [Mycoplasmatota bacterium]|nr:hypothetical protein KHQ81_03300 [Mycoplasmatota bacterium]